MNQVYLILGSNIDPEKNIPLAIKEISITPGIRLLKTSDVYQTRPVGSSQLDFLNAAIMIETELDSFDLKEQILCSIEEKLGRVRVEDKFASRTIDLDIVVFNEDILDTNLFRHDYMILPFSQLLPDIVSPQHGISLKTLATTIKPFSTAKKRNLLSGS